MKAEDIDRAVATRNRIRSLHAAHAALANETGKIVVVLRNGGTYDEFGSDARFSSEGRDDFILATADQANIALMLAQHLRAKIAAAEEELRSLGVEL